MQDNPALPILIQEPDPLAAVTEAFLARLVAELDSELVRAIILHGSCARGEATSYSDVDLVRFVHEIPHQVAQKRFLYFDGRLISISTRTIEQDQHRLTLPEEAIFVVPGIREARILIDKDGGFQKLQQQARDWIWEPLQAAANYYAGELLMKQAEIVHKTLRALLVRDELALAEMVLILCTALTDALAIQRGVLITSGNSYFRQVQASVGVTSEWTHQHQITIDIAKNTTLPATPLETKGFAALRLYQETVLVLLPSLTSEHREVVEQASAVIEQALSGITPP